jgi:3D (Asp-Asp-Asp) domain-containing protein
VPEERTERRTSRCVRRSENEQKREKTAEIRGKKKLGIAGYLRITLAQPAYLPISQVCYRSSCTGSFSSASKTRFKGVPDMRVQRIVSLAAAMMAMPLVLAAQTGEDKTTETRVESKPIPYQVVYELTRSVGARRMLTKQDGQNGKVVRTYTVFFKNGKPVSKTLESTERIEPVDKIVQIGISGYQPSRSRFVKQRTLTMTATAYDPSPRTIPGTTGRTANGMRARYGLVAVDRRVIPLGTLLYVEGYGFAIAADTGGAIKGNKIDLCYNTRSEALQFGRRKVTVHILKGA